MASSTDGLAKFSLAISLRCLRWSASSCGMAAAVAASTRAPASRAAANPTVSTGAVEGEDAMAETTVHKMDPTEVYRYLGKRLGGGQLREPVTATDIRRWVQGMQYPNPLHYDEDYAARSPFGRIVAPQSFAV